MTPKVVVDTSVIIKLLNTDNELNIEQARAILDEALDGNIELLAPEVAKYEVGNGLLKGKRLRVAEAKVALGAAYSLPIEFVVETQESAMGTYEYALKYGLTYYDASFVFLASYFGATLVTDNVKHQGKVRSVKVVDLKDYKG